MKEWFKRIGLNDKDTALLIGRVHAFIGHKTLHYYADVRAKCMCTLHCIYTIELSVRGKAA